MNIAFKQCVHTYILVKSVWHRSIAPFLKWLKQQTIQKRMFLVQTIKKKLQGLQSENTTVGHFYCSAAAVYRHGSEIITDSKDTWTTS